MGLELFLGSLEKVVENTSTKQITNFEKIFRINNVDCVVPRHISTINEGMVGKSVNEVKYIRKQFMLDGEKVEGVFPEFKTEFDCSLPESMYKASDNEQMKFCTNKLAEQIKIDPEFAKKFTSRQLEQIENIEPRISGLTWHHSEIPGKIQLVNSYDHSMARHTGGRSIWGGGSESR